MQWELLLFDERCTKEGHHAPGAPFYFLHVELDKAEP